MNNVENAYVPNAAAGTWTVIVSGYNVPMGPQRFALVVDTAPTDAGLPTVRASVDERRRRRPGRPAAPSALMRTGDVSVL